MLAGLGPSTLCAQLGRLRELFRLSGPRSNTSRGDVLPRINYATREGSGLLRGRQHPFEVKVRRFVLPIRLHSETSRGRLDELLLGCRPVMHPKVEGIGRIPHVPREPSILRDVLSKDGSHPGNRVRSRHQLPDDVMVGLGIKREEVVLLVPLRHQGPGLCLRRTGTRRDVERHRRGDSGPKPLEKRVHILGDDSAGADTHPRRDDPQISPRRAGPVLGHDYGPALMTTMGEMAVKAGAVNESRTNVAIR